MIKPIRESKLNIQKKNILGYRNIYLVFSGSIIDIDGCVSINENIFHLIWRQLKNIMES